MVWSRADDIIDIHEDGSGDAASNVSADVAQLPQLDRQRVTSNSLWVRHPRRRCPPAKNFTVYYRAASPCVAYDEAAYCHERSVVTVSVYTSRLDTTVSLKTNSHRKARHDTDWTVLLCLVWRC